MQNARPQMESLEIEVHSLANGAQIYDFGAAHAGTSAAGILLAKICMADLADISLVETGDSALPMSVEVKTDHPLTSCMASQYAGWPLSVGEYFAMCSGPARVARGREKVLEEYELVSASESVVAVLETSKLPGESIVEAIASECNVTPDRIQLCVARTKSLPGTLQVVARSVETAIHKLHELEFNLRCIEAASGTSLLPPVAKDDLTALGWTNDSVLYGAIVQLSVDCDAGELKRIGPQIPSCSSAEFGTPFLEIFERFDRDFYKIDSMLFSPARVIFNNVRSGETFAFGEQRHDILLNSWDTGSYE